MIATFMNKPGNHKALANQIGEKLIGKVVDDFYNLIQTHPTLARPFATVEDWPSHKDSIANFWWVALGGKPQKSYRYDPIRKHVSAGFNAALLTEWQELFDVVIKSHIETELAEKWFLRVQMIGKNLLLQNDRLIGK